MAPVGQPPAYPPVTAVPAYVEGSSGRSRGLTIGVAVALVVAIAVCGLVGVGSVVLLDDDNSGTSAASAPSPSPSPSPSDEGRVRVLPTDFPNILPTDFPIPGLADGTPHTVVYEVTGDGREVTVAYLSDRDFLDFQSERVDLPWRKELTINIGFLPVTLTAYALPGDGISCRISVDGEQVASAAGDGSAACVGTAIR